MRYAVTGGLGFIGCRVARDLIERGHHVVLIDNGTTSPHPLAHRLLTGSCELRDCDLTQAKATEDALADVDGVFHAAALANKAERQMPRELLHLNLTSTANVLEAARRATHRRVVFASTAVVYGEGFRQDPLLESAQIPDVTTIYAATKLAGEHLMRAYTHQWGVAAISLRFMNVYGYQPPTHQWREIIPLTLERIERGERPVIHGDGLSTYDFIHIDDVARGVVIALESDVAPGEFNIGTGRGTSVRTLVETLLRLTGSPLKAELRPDIPSPTKRYVADVRRTEAMLGFTAEIALEAGLQRVIDEYAREQAVPLAA